MYEMVHYITVEYKLFGYSGENTISRANLLNLDGYKMHFSISPQAVVCQSVDQQLRSKMVFEVFM